MARGNVLVRSARPEETTAFLGFADELVRSTGGRGGATRGVFGADRALAQRFADLLADPARRILFAADQTTGKPIGMAVLTRDEISALLGAPAVHLSHLVVPSPHRDRGAARALIGAAVEFAEGLGCDHVIASAHGRDAARFFTRLGFGSLTTRRIVSVSTLRRNLGLPDGAGEAATRRRTVRRERILLSRPLPLRSPAPGGRPHGSAEMPRRQPHGDSGAA